MPAPTHVTTGCVSTEGDDLYYEVRGDGLPLLLIPGGGGNCGPFVAAAGILAADYKVITYDRRGNCHSTRHAPQNFDMAQQSRDAVAVLRAAGEGSAHVFGNSSGAIIALDMLKTQPQAIRTAVVHEPPAIRVLPDSQKYLRFFAGLYHTAYTLGSGVAMLRFALALGFLPKLIVHRPPRDVEPVRDDPVDFDFFMKGEMLGATNYLPDIESIRRSGARVVMAAGQWTLDTKRFYGRTAPILAELIGCELAVFPGHHVAHMDQPREWAAALRDILRGPSDTVSTDAHTQTREVTPL